MFDPQYDMAIREWARVSQPVAKVMHAVDAQRIEDLQSLFQGLGYAQADSSIRASVFYTHQIGHYTIGVDDSRTDREQKLNDYLKVLAGPAWDDKPNGSAKS